MNPPQDKRAEALSSDRRPVRRIAALYRACAFLVFNTALVLIVLNLGLYVVLTARDYLTRDPRTGPERKYGTEAMAAAYPDLSQEQRSQLLSETWSRPWLPDAMVMFHERPYAGNYVRVHPAGFRHGRDQGVWPPAATNLNVFVFGGSTTFGYGVGDEQTMPSYLQGVLATHSARPVKVYNFAVGYFSSRHERIRFENLLVKGHRPDVVVFVDGINESEWAGDEPVNAGAFRLGFAGAQTHPLQKLWLRLPMVRAAVFLRKRAKDKALAAAAEEGAADLEQRLHRAREQYVRNKEIVEGACREVDVQPVFVWQPVPGFEYDTNYHRFIDTPRFKVQRVFYEGMKELMTTNDLGTNFIWCADLQRDAKELLYVDSVHYNPEFCRRFAEAIVTRMLERPTMVASLQRHP